MTSIIETLRTYLLTCPNLEPGAFLVEQLGELPVQYAISQIAGERIIETDIVGNKTMQFPFVLRSAHYTDSDLERIETSGFYEAFADWMDAQTKAKVFPSLGTGKKVESIGADTWGYVFEQGVSGTAIYQISCTMNYKQLA